MYIIIETIQDEINAFADLDPNAMKIPKPNKYRKDFIEKLLSKGKDEEGLRNLRSYQIDDNPKNFFKNITYETSIHKLLTYAVVSESPWSGSYWPIIYGVLSSRYSNDKRVNSMYDYYQQGNMIYTDSKSYNKSIAYYTQPDDYNKTYNVYTNYSEYVNLYYSPSEKYDFYMGDYNFTLTNFMKKVGLQVQLEKGEVPSWMGICHGWGVAAYRELHPNKTLTLLAADGKTWIQFLPDDLKALVSAYWAEANFESNFAGYRCGTLKMETVPTDRSTGLYTDYDCFGVNPATFHIVLTNSVGFYRKSFVFEPHVDDQIWNHPVYGYYYTHFNPLNNITTSLEDAIITVEQARQKRNNFLNFLVKNMTNITTHLVGVKMRIDYMYESSPLHKTRCMDDIYKNETYWYVLELDKDGNCVGGEWYINTHPNYVWGPREGDEFPWLEDRIIPTFNGTIEEIKKATKYSADKAKKRNSPLRAVIRYMMDQIYKPDYDEDDTEWIDDADLLDRKYNMIKQGSSNYTLSPIFNFTYETKDDGTKVRTENYMDGTTIRTEFTAFKSMKYISRSPDYEPVVAIAVTETKKKDDGSIVRYETMSDGYTHRVETGLDYKWTRYISKEPIPQNFTNYDLDEDLLQTNGTQIRYELKDNGRIDKIVTNTDGSKIRYIINPPTVTSTLPPPVSAPTVDTSTSGTPASPTPTPHTPPTPPPPTPPTPPTTNLASWTETRPDGVIVRYEPQSDGGMIRTETYPDGRIIRYIRKPSPDSSTASPTMPSTPSTPTPATIPPASSTPSSTSSTPSDSDLPASYVKPDGTVVRFERQPDGTINRLETSPNGRTIRYIPARSSTTTPTAPPTPPTPPTPLTSSSAPPTDSSTPTSAPQPFTRPDGTYVWYELQPSGVIWRYERGTDGRTFRYIPSP
jgi:hypothetical protein